MDPSVLALLTEPSPQELKVKEQISQLRLMGARLRYKKEAKAQHRSQVTKIVRYLLMPPEFMLETLKIANLLDTFISPRRDRMVSFTQVVPATINYPCSFCLLCKNITCFNGKPFMVGCVNCTKQQLLWLTEYNNLEVAQGLVKVPKFWNFKYNYKYTLDIFNELKRVGNSVWIS